MSTQAIRSKLKDIRHVGLRSKASDVLASFDLVKKAITRIHSPATLSQLDSDQIMIRLLETVGNELANFTHATIQMDEECDSIRDAHLQNGGNSGQMPADLEKAEDIGHEFGKVYESFFASLGLAGNNDDMDVLMASSLFIDTVPITGKKISASTRISMARHMFRL